MALTFPKLSFFTISLINGLWNNGDVAKEEVKYKTIYKLILGAVKGKAPKKHPLAKSIKNIANLLPNKS